MADLLLELFCEEIPARMQARAAADLERLMLDALKDAGLEPETSLTRVTPRRLTLAVTGLADKTAAVSEERKGPRIDAPEQAIQGFLKSAGVTLDRCDIEQDKKGSFYVVRTSRPGRATPDVIAEAVPEMVRRFPWPKSMRWGSGSLRWVRPLHSILCLFDGEVVDFEVGGIASGKVTRGHRFMAPDEIEVEDFDRYEQALRAAYVMTDPAERMATIRDQAEKLAAEDNLELIDDPGLLAETAGLVEWPVVLMGAFDEAFLDVPPEVIVTSIRSHQKCFALCDANANLASQYLLVSNLVASDGGAQIVDGNNRVIAARLSDAKFFWELDRKTPLEARLPRLDDITFHARLGTQGQRVKRIEALAGEIAGNIGADEAQAKLAARLAKADLVTEMVGEFPELQGLMGSYYARKEGLPEPVCEAIRDHYKPQGPADAVPEGKVAQAVALADKIDTLVGFWSIDEKPTGSKDPYALRRAALGVIRIVLEGELRLSLAHAAALARSHLTPAACHAGHDAEPGEDVSSGHETLTDDLMAFFADRLKVYLRDKGVRHDLIDAVFALGDQDDLLMIVKRVEALSEFLGTEDGQTLLAGTKRATNILSIEEKKDGRSYADPPDATQLKKGAEKELYRAIGQVGANAKKAVEGEDFTAAMRHMAKLRAAVDDFFDNVTVNDPDPSFRENRLKLLNRIRAATLAVADFSKIEG